MADVITDPQVKALVESKVNNSFGLTVDQVANKCKNYGRFKAWLNSDVAKIKQVLLHVKANGVSPAFFAGYERSEGYNRQWGWLNHTRQKGDYQDDAVYTAKWIVSQSKNMTGTPAWIDYANYKDFVPSSVKQQGNAHFKNMPSGSIGRVIIAGTAAATWAVYYPNGLLASYNGVQNYSNPMKIIAQAIVEWGGDLNATTDPIDPDPTPPPDDSTPDKPSSDDDILDLFYKLSKNLADGIKDMLTINLYDYGKSNTFANQFVKVEKTYDNMYKIQPNLAFTKSINKITKTVVNDMKDIIGGTIPKPDPPTDPDPDPEPDPEPDPNAKKYFPVKKSNAGINFWKKSNHATGTIQRNMCYGWRSTGDFHAGYDIGSGGNTGYKVYAVSSGEVTRIEWLGSAGFVVVIKHSEDNYHAMYMHLVANSNVVKIGDKVKAGQHIATMGNTGGNYATHLHFELSKNGKFHNEVNTVNPESYLGITGDNKSKLPTPP